MKCPKNVINGPCGGYRDNYCEVSNECVFINIFRSKSPEELRELLLRVVLDKRFKVRNYFPVYKRALTEFMRKVRRGERLIVYEVVARLSDDLGRIVNELKRNVSGDDIVLAITDSPLGTLTHDSLLLANLLRKEVHVADILINVALRNKCVESIIRGAVSATANNLRNFLIITGDWTSCVDNVFTLDSVRGIYTLRLIGDLGITPSGRVEVPPQPMHVGSITNPESPYTLIEILRTVRKVIAGSEFIITQPIYNIRKYVNFMEGLRKYLKDNYEVPIIPSYAPIIKKKHLSNLKKIGIYITNKELIKALDQGNYDRILEANIEFIKDVIDASNGIKAMYISTYGNLTLAYDFINALRKVL